MRGKNTRCSSTNVASAHPLFPMTPVFYRRSIRASNTRFVGWVLVFEYHSEVFYLGRRLVKVLVLVCGFWMSFFLGISELDGKFLRLSILRPLCSLCSLVKEA